MRSFLFILCFCLIVPHIGHSAATTSPPKVIVSLAMQKYLIQHLVGDAVSVTVLATAGADPHTYEPTPAQMRAVAAADIYFTVGAPFEAAWLPRLQGAAPQLRIIPLRAVMPISDNTLETLPHNAKDTPKQQAHPVTTTQHPQTKEPDTDRDHNHTHGGEDPHVWLSPALTLATIPTIAAELARLLPEQAVSIAQQAEQLQTLITGLQKEIHTQFAPFPPSQRIFLTFHPAWHYFALEFEAKELSIEIEGKEPSPKAMKETIDLARKHAFSAIFVEPQFPKRAANTIAQSIGAEVVTIDPLQEDWPALLRQFAKGLAQSFASVQE